MAKLLETNTFYFCKPTHGGNCNLVWDDCVLLFSIIYWFCHHTHASQTIYELVCQSCKLVDHLCFIQVQLILLSSFVDYVFEKCVLLAPILNYYWILWNDIKVGLLSMLVYGLLISLYRCYIG
mgnify:CR=1 FL=1